jgi:hypothetical protein
MRAADSSLDILKTLQDNKKHLGFLAANWFDARNAGLLRDRIKVLMLELMLQDQRARLQQQQLKRRGGQGQAAVVTAAVTAATAGSDPMQEDLQLELQDSETGGAQNVGTRKQVGRARG